MACSRILRSSLLAAALALAVSPALAQKAEDAFGVWLNRENGSNIEMYKCGCGLCVKVANVTDGQKTD